MEGRKWRDGGKEGCHGRNEVKGGWKDGMGVGRERPWSACRHLSLLVARAVSVRLSPSVCQLFP
jgi:hypothetical protein